MVEAFIHPTAVVHPDARLGTNVHVGAYTVIRANVFIGNNVYISSHVSLGDEAEHSTEKYELNPRDGVRPVRIGNNVVIREFVTVTRPTKEVTRIADHAYIMGHVYVAHDVSIGEHAVVSNCAILGGWTRIQRGANLGLSSTTHQFTTIGAYAMVAANATVVKDIPPLGKYIPHKPLGVNAYAIAKWKLPLRGRSLAELYAQPAYAELLAEFTADRFSERQVYPRN
jgi:UDP-N-acetylglucosamine acyltransferase